MDTNTEQLDEFKQALTLNGSRYYVHLTTHSIQRLADYFQLLTTWNQRFNLVAPSLPGEFAKRHILESLLLLHYLPTGASVVDIGSGAGLPIVPCLSFRPDLNAVLIESSQKKAVFLREALNLFGNLSSAKVIAERFEKLPTPDADFITCRALDRFTELLPRLIEWSPQPVTLLLFGGEDLRKALDSQKLSFEAHHIPKSERRFLFVIKRT
jgi:16S rRNA (guanine527-N7)-methyltransferase